MRSHSVFTGHDGLLQEVKLQLIQLKAKNEPVPADLRFKILKYVLKLDRQNPEDVRTEILKEIFLHDQAYFISKIQGWHEKIDERDQALSNIGLFFGQLLIPNKISFKQHAYYCFCLSAFASGKTIDEIPEAYDKQLHTMVMGTIHPGSLPADSEYALGDEDEKWSIKSEVENQFYAKYVFHVSGNGLADVETLNEMTAFEIDETDDSAGYCCARLIAVPCDEDVGFDGIKSKSLKVLKHDFIHSGFLKYAITHDRNRYFECLEKMAKISRGIQRDPELAANPVLKGEVQAAYFMWTHELTTSMFVHGWPRRLPKQHTVLGGQFASAPQMILRLAAKLNMIPELYKNEIVNEAGVLQSVGVEMQTLQSDNEMTDHDKIKEVMGHLDNGYRYLHEKFGELYGHQSWYGAFAERMKVKIYNWLGF